MSESKNSWQPQFLLLWLRRGGQAHRPVARGENSFIPLPQCGAQHSVVGGLVDVSFLFSSGPTEPSERLGGWALYSSSEYLEVHSPDVSWSRQALQEISRWRVTASQIPEASFLPAKMPEASCLPVQHLPSKFPRRCSRFSCCFSCEFSADPTRSGPGP